MMMKKLTLALAASAIIVSGASAHNIGTGFYAGIHGGYGAVTAKQNGFANGGILNTGNENTGNGQGNIGFHGGYGWVHSCFYLGGEIGYTFENAKITDSLGTAAGFGQSQLKRNGYFRAAVRGGYLFTPSTLGYIALGANWGKWTANDNLNFFNNAVPGSGSRNTAAFAPGVGLETAVHKNVYLRVEYNYEFAPSVRATNGAVPSSFTSWTNVRDQSGKVGLSYKF
jgi:outer membrane immunogenic protein